MIAIAKFNLSRLSITPLRFIIIAIIIVAVNEILLVHKFNNML